MPMEKADAVGGWRSEGRRNGSESAKKASLREMLIFRRWTWWLDGGSGDVGGGGKRDFGGNGAAMGGGEGIRQDRGGDMAGSVLIGHDLSARFIIGVGTGKIEKKTSQYLVGDAGDRTPCLSHAKRALYHLSYIPL
ncbi:hypothetical protein Vadar_000937 [Vaccinium darrowii]|uniref:Uncharacterized protein n=1 Tax=Vaccinium darrowii TaxID=229202 RepID=A0ACB7XVS6_9ERIC|nr:hypothetical protein Vadar_000937 [Vaccinium darrowii]